MTSMLGKFLRAENKRIAAEKTFRLIEREPRIGEKCLVVYEGHVLFCVRTSQNCFQSGVLTIPPQDGITPITMEEV